MFSALPEGYPRITEVPDKTTMVVEMGFPMRLKCSIVGAPPATVIWYKDKKPVDVDTSNRVQVISDPSRPGCKLCYPYQNSLPVDKLTRKFVCMILSPGLKVMVDIRVS